MKKAAYPLRRSFWCELEQWRAMRSCVIECEQCALECEHEHRQQLTCNRTVRIGASAECRNMTNTEELLVRNLNVALGFRTDVNSETINEMPKRLGNLKEKFLSFENFDLAEKKACKHKKHTFGVKQFRKLDRDVMLNELINQLRNGTFESTTARIEQRMVDGGKIRNISIQPYYPDRILHHAIMNVIQDRLYKALIAHTYNSIPKRGLHSLNKSLKKQLHGNTDNKFVLKIDIRKFYESVSVEVAMNELSRYIKDKFILGVILEILQKAKGLSIGGLLSQIISNIILNALDHFVIESIKLEYYRYADDITILSDSKEELHEVMHRIMNFLWYNYHLELNRHRQIFNIDDRGIDFVGFVFNQKYTSIRKRVKKNYIKKRHIPQSVASYNGMLKFCNSRNLIYNVIELDNHATRSYNQCG